MICDHGQSEKLIAPTFTDNAVLPLKDQSLSTQFFQCVIFNYSFNGIAICTYTVSFENRTLIEII